MSSGTSISRLDLLQQRASRAGFRLAVEKGSHRHLKYLIFQKGQFEVPRKFTSLGKAENFIAAYEKPSAQNRRRRSSKTADRIRAWNVKTLRDLADLVESGRGELLTREVHSESIPFVDQFFNRLGTELHMLLVRVPDKHGDRPIEDQR